MNIHPRTHPRQQPRQLGGESEAEQEARDHVGQVERQPRPCDHQQCGGCVAGSNRPCVQIHHLLRRQRGDPTAERERYAPHVSPAQPAESGAEQADAPPRRHLPGGVGALAEQEVRHQHPDRADGEARQRAEGVADDERDRGDRLDIGQRDERVTAERGDGRQGAHDRDHPRRRPPALVGEPAERQHHADEEE